MGACTCAVAKGWGRVRVGACTCAVASSSKPLARTTAAEKVKRLEMPESCCTCTGYRGGEGCRGYGGGYGGRVRGGLRG